MHNLLDKRMFQWSSADAWVSYGSFPVTSQLRILEVHDLQRAVICCNSKLFLSSSISSTLLHFAKHGRFFSPPDVLAAVAWQRGSSLFFPDSKDHFGQCFSRQRLNYSLSVACKYLGQALSILITELIGKMPYFTAGKSHQGSRAQHVLCLWSR